MKPHIDDREKQRTTEEHAQRQLQARNDKLEAKDQDFYVRLGISAPPHSDPDMSLDTAFRGSLSTEDRTDSEQNAHKYYDTHVHELNGHAPAPVDYQRATELIGSHVEHAPNWQEVALDPEEPELDL